MDNKHFCKKERKITWLSHLFFLLLLVNPANSGATVFPVKSFDNFNKAQQLASAGDSIVWKSGTYANVNLDILRNGIILCPEKSGSVVFTGQSAINLYADSVLLTGFQFIGGSTKGDILKVSGSYNVLENLNFSDYESQYYLNILPGTQYNLVYKCNFEKKPETIPQAVVEIQAHESIPGYHKVSYCSFSNHTAPLGSGSDYGIEALRIGYSFQSGFISRTIVEYCYFTKCNGDGEIISSKAHENIFRYNTFEDNGDAHFTLRHGSDNVIYGNFFLGGAGIRIKEGQNQMVYNNYFQTGKKFAINLMNHRADPLENIIIAHNSFINSGRIMLGGEGDFKPRKVAFSNNLFLDAADQIISDPTGDEKFSGNLINHKGKDLPSGFDRIRLNVDPNRFGIKVPQEDDINSIVVNTAHPDLLDIPELDDDPFIESDIMKQSRIKSKQHIAGCFIPNDNMEIKPYASTNNTGPGYLLNSDAGQKVERPNILYIFTDDQTIRSLSSYSTSHKWVETPNIAKLAEQGVRFEYSYTGAKCVPSRGNALTGQFQSNYSKETEYWPVEFRKQGYFTGMIGKWHWNMPRHNETWDWSAVWEHHLPGNKTNYYWDQSLRMNGDTLLELKQYSTDAYTDLTIDFIKNRVNDKDQPWYFWLCYGAVHGPYTPAERHMQKYLDVPEVEIPADIFGPRPHKPEYMRDLTMWKRDENGNPQYKDRSLDSWVKQYNQAVKAIDEGIGRIVNVLEETGQAENTIIIFTSDNGYAWGQHGFRLKIAPYDANLLTPLIVSQPRRFPTGQVCKHPVNGVDIIKTIHSLCNITPSNRLDGRDFSDLLENPSLSNWNSSPMIQTYTGSLYGEEAIVKALKLANESGDWEKFVVHNTGIRAWIMMRKENYKYVRYMYNDYIEELYDLENDPEELENLAVKAENHKLLGEYRLETELLFKEKGATFIDLLPEPKLVSK